jgi:hypothetical protein
LSQVIESLAKEKDLKKSGSTGKKMMYGNTDANTSLEEAQHSLNYEPCSCHAENIE